MSYLFAVVNVIVSIIGLIIMPIMLICVSLQKEELLII